MMDQDEDQSDKLDPDTDPQKFAEMYGIWAYLRTFPRFLALFEAVIRNRIKVASRIRNSDPHLSDKQDPDPHEGDVKSATLLKQ